MKVGLCVLMGCRLAYGKVLGGLMSFSGYSLSVGKNGLSTPLLVNHGEYDEVVSMQYRTDSH